MEDRNLLEAQFYWAFTCLVLAGRRGPEEFHAELTRRSGGSYPGPAEVGSIVEEALCHLPAVVNQALAKKCGARRPLSGWERHVLALSGRPVDMAFETVDGPQRSKNS
jgi:hypothetical protein